MDKYQVLKQYFGYEEFREGQEGLIDSILAGRESCLPAPENLYAFRCRH